MFKQSASRSVLILGAAAVGLLVVTLSFADTSDDRLARTNLDSGQLSTRQAAAQPTVVAEHEAFVRRLIEDETSIAGAEAFEIGATYNAPASLDFSDAIVTADRLVVGRVVNQFAVAGTTSVPGLTGAYLLSILESVDGSRTEVVQDVGVAKGEGNQPILGYRGCSKPLVYGLEYAVLIQQSQIVLGRDQVLNGNAFEIQNGVLSAPCKSDPSVAAVDGRLVGDLFLQFTAAQSQ